MGYNEPPAIGTTSDHFIDVKNLIYEPKMAAAFKNAFAPVGLMIDYWENEVIAGSSISIPVVVINDLEPAWSGKVHLRSSARRKNRLSARSSGLGRILRQPESDLQLHGSGRAGRL